MSASVAEKLVAGEKMQSLTNKFVAHAGVSCSRENGVVGEKGGGGERWGEAARRWIAGEREGAWPDGDGDGER